MTRRSLSVDLGDGTEELAVTIKGCPCGTEDLQMALVAFAREWKRNRRPKAPAPQSVKPCGCKDPK